MNRVVAVVLLAFVVVICGDPVKVEKRIMPIGPAVSGIDLLGEGGLVDNLELQAFLKSLAAVVKQIRLILQGLNVCPKKPGGYKAAGHYEPGNEPEYVPDYKPNYKHGHQHDHDSDYVPRYRPNEEYRRGSEVSEVDMACELPRPMLEAIVKMLLQVEKILGCMMGKDKSYKGDYKECQH